MYYGGSYSHKIFKVMQWGIIKSKYHKNIPGIDRNGPGEFLAQFLGRLVKN